MWEWTIELYKFYRDIQKQQDEFEIQQLFFGRMCATIGNFAGKSTKKHLTEHDFFKMRNDNRQADEDEIRQLMEDPKLKYRFRKDGQ